MHKKYSIGIDTGGTYTDAVIIDLNNQKLLASAKALTTKGDLTIGISKAMQAVINEMPKAASNIAFVSLSTTLCTNALVEGHGSSLGVVLIGFDQEMIDKTQISKAIPDCKIVSIQGGHNFSGNEVAVFDEKGLRQVLCNELSKYESYAVASQYSIRNPEHEQKAMDMIREITGAPVTASSHLTSALDAPKRALTACFNARIISMIYRLEQSVKATLESLNIDAPIMIVKGDGAVSHIRIVRDRPIETILSGPAASVMGARFLTGLNDFLISDVGGTTTDVATVIKGWPSLDETGSMVGNFKTLTKAINMKTIGLGGDSEVFLGGISGFELQLSSSRVIPIALLAKKWPEIEQQLEISLGQPSGMATSLKYVIRPKQKNPVHLPEADERFLQSIPLNQPVAFSDCINGAGHRARIKRLVERGALQISGLTPSDAAHVLGYQSQWSTTAAQLGCELLGRAKGFICENRFKQKPQLEAKIKQFAEQIHHQVCCKSSHVLLEELVGVSFNADDLLIQAICNQRRSDTNDNVPTVKNLQLRFQPTFPIVAVGGPAPVYYPQIGKRLNSNTLIPEGSEVANAIGAAVGAQKISSSVTLNRAEKKGFSLHYSGVPKRYDTADTALQAARELVKELVIENAWMQSGSDLSLEQFASIAKVEISEKFINIPNLEGNEALVSAAITAEIVRFA